ncbi:glutamate racemase [Natranaerobius trueperi]|uniref:Glutamate racemase n=2 Tax=Natranaerobius trueperi TaxID=759412 RepID=A0A226BXR7_9FIRM|nr:glutamate racemase [Natranaerobius trueperi]
MNKDQAIALLDSGVGGLTVAKDVINFLPNERIIYFGDLARMPYGPRPHEQVRHYVREITDFLMEQDTKLLIVACNSASASGLSEIRSDYDIPIIDVINPGARAAISATKTKKIGVIGTEGTIKSKAYEKAIKRIDPEVEVLSQPCPLFVLIVENDLIDYPETKTVAREYLLPLKEQGVDTLIMGCTHYPFMENIIQDVMGNDVKLISSAGETARQTKELLKERNLLRQGDNSKHRFFVSAESKKFMQIGQKLLGFKPNAYQVVF